MKSPLIALCRAAIVALLVLSAFFPYGLVQRGGVGPAYGSQVINGVIVDDELIGVLSNASAADRIYAVVGYDKPPTQSDVDALRALGLSVLPYQQLPFAAVAGTKDQIWAIVEVPGVRTLYWNRPIYPLTHIASPDPLLMFADTNAYGTGVTSVGADKAWRMGYTGQGIGVAVIDTGIDTTNPSLAFSPQGPVVQNVRIMSDEILLYPNRTLDVYLESQVATDNFGHGTHVAGSVAGSGAASSGFYLGVAPGAHIIGLDGLTCTLIWLLGGCLVTILSAFDYVLINQQRYNIRVETNSWGSGPGPFDPNDPITVAVNELVKRNITVLFAAGNDGPSPDTMTREARNPNVIAVAAGQPSGGLAQFSSRGVPVGVTPTITSPGHLIISARVHTAADMQIFTVLGYDAIVPPQYIPNYLVAQGTSMATPVAAGVVALMLSANPSLTPAQVKQIIQATATSMLGYEPYEVGAGYVNAEAAVKAALGLKAIRAPRVKLPAQTELLRDTSSGQLVLAYPYRASILGLGLLGFRHFPFSFPVYTNDSLPITITLRWDTLQQYSAYTRGYRIIVYDPKFNPVLRVDTDLLTLKTGLTVQVNGTTRANRTPAGGAYWYVQMFNFNPGWGILDIFVKVSYPLTFKPPFKGELIRPSKLVLKPDRPVVAQGGALQLQGFLADDNYSGVEGALVNASLVGPLGLTLWSGTVLTADGRFSFLVELPAGIPDGLYTFYASADGVAASASVAVSSSLPQPLSASAALLDNGSLLVQVRATDGLGMAYVASFLNYNGAELGLFLEHKGGGLYEGALTLPQGTAPLQVVVYLVNLAGNKAQQQLEA